MDFDRRRAIRRTPHIFRPPPTSHSLHATSWPRISARSAHCLLLDTLGLTRPTLPYSTYALSRRLTPNSILQNFSSTRCAHACIFAALQSCPTMRGLRMSIASDRVLRVFMKITAVRASPANLRTRHADLELVVCPRGPSRAALSARGPGLLLVRAGVLSLEDSLLSFNAPLVLVITPFSSPDLRSALSSPPVRPRGQLRQGCAAGPGVFPPAQSPPAFPGRSAALLARRRRRQRDRRSRPRQRRGVCEGARCAAEMRGDVFRV